MKRAIVILCLAATHAMGLCGCAAQPDETLISLVSRGEFGEARVRAQSQISDDQSDRRYMLDRMNFGILALADGLPQAAEKPLDEVYTVLRTQGVNADKTVASVVINEDLKLWKGEPFEQAMAFHYVSLYYAMLGEWDNVRAAAGNSLFHLRDFGTDTKGRRLESIDMAAKAARDDEYLDHGYVAVQSNFALGYLMNAIANRQMGRADEASDNLRAAAKADEDLRELTDRLREKSSYNTILVVDYGIGPRKIATGPDGAIAAFAPQTRSDSRQLQVSAGGRTEDFPVVCDLNQMSHDHMWNNLEDVRQAKSAIGTGLLVGGAVLADHGSHGGNDSQAIAGVAMMLAGIFAKAGAHADTRYCEVMPQRVYVTPVTVRSAHDKIELQVEGEEASRMILTGLAPPPVGKVQLRYVRLVSERRHAPQWAASGRIEYDNDAAAADDGTPLPYILDGSCVRTPTQAALDAYQRAGHLKNLTVWQLEELYRDESISIAGAGRTPPGGLHVLEGGDWLFTPLAGTAGYARLFGQTHPPYRPRSPEVAAMARELHDDARVSRH